MPRTHKYPDTRFEGRLLSDSSSSYFSFSGSTTVKCLQRIAMFDILSPVEIALRVSFIYSELGPLLQVEPNQKHVWIVWQLEKLTTTRREEALLSAADSRLRPCWLMTFWERLR